MDHPVQLAEQFRGFYFGNLVGANLKDLLEGVTWKQANTSVQSLNSIAKLVFHLDYYVQAQIEVFEGRELTAKDKYSYEMDSIESESDWNDLKTNVFRNAEHYYSLVKQMPEEQLWEDFWQEKYGNYYQNIHIILQHAYYHLGQIAIIKKLIIVK